MAHLVPRSGFETRKCSSLALSYKKVLKKIPLQFFQGNLEEAKNLVDEGSSDINVWSTNSINNHLKKSKDSQRDGVLHGGLAKNLSPTRTTHSSKKLVYTGNCQRNVIMFMSEGQRVL